MQPTSAFLTGLFCVFVLLSLVWLIQLRTKNAGLVDAIWSYSLGFLGVLYAFVGNAPTPVRWLLGLMAGVWGFRLGTYLLLRMRGKGEDGRYARKRAEWGPKANRQLLIFFHIQTQFAVLLSIAFLIIAYRPDVPATSWIVVALLVWTISVLGEGVADYQLAQFKRNPANKGRVCREGLWRYSRHPNYFFESLHWVSYVFLAAGAPYWWATLASPVIMAWLLLRVSGVPLTEQQVAATRPDYAEYIRTTSAFIPWPPKKS